MSRLFYPATYQRLINSFQQDKDIVTQYIADIINKSTAVKSSSHKNKNIFLFYYEILKK